jgi:hypothetical protein
MHIFFLKPMLSRETKLRSRNRKYLSAVRVGGGALLVASQIDPETSLQD